MSLLARQLAEDRAARDIAKGAYEQRLAGIKADFERRGLAGRVADEMGERAMAMLDEAVDVAESHPGVVGGTIFALALWFLRNPIVAWVEHFLGPTGLLAKDKRP